MRNLKSHSMRLMDTSDGRQGRTSRDEITSPGDVEIELTLVANERIAGSWIARGVW